MARSDVIRALDDWVGAGLISEEQARAISQYDATQHQDELPGWVEPVAYLGAALVGVALFLFGAQFWDQLASWGRFSLGALITVILFVVGLVLRRSDSAAAGRAASFSWFLVVAGVAATAGLLFSDILDLDPDWAPALTASIALTTAVAIYLFASTTLQQVAMAGATVFLITTLPGLLPLGEVAWVVGLLFLTVGVVWLLLTWGGLMRPENAGWVLGSLFAIGVGFGAFDDNGFWSALGVVIGLALVWLSTRFDRRSLLGLGVIALMIWIPTTVVILFEESIAVPVAILITGVVTLTAVVATVRLGRRGDNVTLPGSANDQR